MTAKRFEIECISFDKNDIFEDMIKQLQSKEVFLVSLHERFENEVINENTPPLLVMPCPNQNVLDNVCDLLNELDEDFDDALHTISKIQEENQALQEEIKDYNDVLARLEEKLQRERTATQKQHQKWSKEAEQQIKELTEKNEKLKSDVLYWRIIAQSLAKKRIM